MIYHKILQTLLWENPSTKIVYVFTYVIQISKSFSFFYYEYIYKYSVIFTKLIWKSQF